MTLKKGQWFGEYVGQLVPLDVPSMSMYRFEIAGVCAIDAELCGSWTRFVNSSCIPNVSAWTDTIGKRHAVYLQASKDIPPETELTFNYGKHYFGAAGLKCGCAAMKRPHTPGEAKMQAKMQAKVKKRTLWARVAVGTVLRIDEATVLGDDATHREQGEQLM